MRSLETPHSGLAGLARREFLILAALGAAGLVGALRWTRLGRLFADGEEPTKLGALAQLGRIWREMTRHATGKAKNGPAFDALGRDMEAALTALQALAEQGKITPDTAAALQTVFRERHSHLGIVVYHPILCYEAVMWYEIGASCGNVEKQAAALDKLAAQGKLTPAAEAKAREALAREVAFQVKADELHAAAGGEGEAAQAARRVLEDSLEQGASLVEPTEAASKAAEALVDFSVGREPGDG